jgi:hypothetical protein
MHLPDFVPEIRDDSLRGKEYYFIFNVSADII